MSINEIRERVEESKRLNGVFGPQAQDDLECLLELNAEMLEACKNIVHNLSASVDSYELAELKAAIVKAEEAT